MVARACARGRLPDPERLRARAGAAPRALSPARAAGAAGRDRGSRRGDRRPLRAAARSGRRSSCTWLCCGCAAARMASRGWRRGRRPWPRPSATKPRPSASGRQARAAVLIGRAGAPAGCCSRGPPSRQRSGSPPLPPSWTSWRPRANRREPSPRARRPPAPEASSNGTGAAARASCGSLPDGRRRPTAGSTWPWSPRA